VKVRLLLLLAITLALLGTMALTVGTANADGGPHRSGNLTTGGCADCHRAHTGTSTKLITYSSIYALCVSCHGPGSHVPEDVVDGLYTRAPNTGPLRGGGFVNVTMNTSWSPTAPTAPATTTGGHSVVGMNVISTTTPYVSGTVWGIGAINSGPGTSFALECSTCHDPHGGSGGFNTTTLQHIPTYRLLRSDMNSKVTGASSNSSNPLVVADTISHTYTIADTITDKYYGQMYSAPNDKTGTDNNLAPVLSSWCASCHTRIHTTGVAGMPEETSSGDPIYNFRHSTTGSSVEFNFGTATLWPAGSPSCLTCHVSHGSSAFIGPYGDAEVPFPGGTNMTPPFQDAVGLRLNGRGVCEACHNK
jgi:predicted CXXCH cytochrome family protein